LKQLFAGLEPVSARVVLRPIPSYVIRKLAQVGVARKGRGFGFVTFADAEAQKKAVDEFEGKEVEGRALSVKIAVDHPEDSEDAAPTAPE